MLPVAAAATENICAVFEFGVAGATKPGVHPSDLMGRRVWIWDEHGRDKGAPPDGVLVQLAGRGLHDILIGDQIGTIAADVLGGGAVLITTEPMAHWLGLHWRKFTGAALQVRYRLHWASPRLGHRLDQAARSALHAAPGVQSPPRLRPDADGSGWGLWP